jgi:hypothetical protein
MIYLSRRNRRIMCLSPKPMGIRSYGRSRQNFVEEYPITGHISRK